SGELKDGILAADLLRRPEITYDKIAQIVSRETFVTDEIAEQVEIQIKYEGYIQKSNLQVEKMKRMEDKKIPENIDYDAISGLATEALEKLKKIEPLSIAQASRISGVNPADISILLVYIEQGKIAKISK
ncbi:tRNA uridine-5-carboxymethylaminomethyl(34) synthesis enzyme MnmG, partial [Listeria monocytogenes]|nr:tRNA uridine-5-carboxymethylaminomethyl(34) synthesis enzyme MnmG [Listeria monocytogenes]